MPKKKAGNSNTTALSQRKRNKTGTLRWSRDEEEAEQLISLFNVHQNDPNSGAGADPTNLDPAYIREVYNNHPYFSGPIEGSKRRFDLRAFREGYKRLAEEYILNGQARQHQGNCNIAYFR